MDLINEELKTKTRLTMKYYHDVLDSEEYLSLDDETQDMIFEIILKSLDLQKTAASCFIEAMQLIFDPNRFQ